jgi:hypothetical protein
MQIIVSIDDDIALRILQWCAQHRESFDEAVNGLLRIALDTGQARLEPRKGRSAATKTYSLGEPLMSLECIGAALTALDEEDDL